MCRHSTSRSICELTPLARHARTSRWTPIRALSSTRRGMGRIVSFAGDVEAKMRYSCNIPSSPVQGYLSVHATSFSYIHASNPTGESAREYPIVWGRVDCSTIYPLPVLKRRAENARRFFASESKGSVKRVRRYMRGNCEKVGGLTLSNVRAGDSQFVGFVFRDGRNAHGHVRVPCFDVLVPMVLHHVSPDLISNVSGFRCIVIAMPLLTRCPQSPP